MANRIVEALAEQRFSKSLAKIGHEAVTLVNRRIGVATRFFVRMVTPTIPNRVFFHTQENKYCCNPKYIAEEFRRQGFDGIDIVWRGPRNERAGVPEEFTKVAFNTFEYFTALYSSKIVVTNSFLYFGMPVKLKKDQILLQTWHGSLGIKRYGAGDMKDSRLRVKALIKTAKMTKYCISNSDLENNSFRDHFWPTTPILVYGHARNDLFFDNHKKLRDALREDLIWQWNWENYNLTIDDDVKFVMYGPTFRDDKSFEPYDVDFARLYEALKTRFGGKWCVLLRYHPSLSKSKEIDARISALQKLRIPVINVTNHLDMQELIAVTDVAITDYSSWIYDFVLLRRPGFIFATDIADYDQERGFYYPIDTTPFPICVNNDQLIKSVLEYDEKSYVEKVEQFLIDKGCIDDGHSGERAVQLIRDLLEGKEPTDVVMDIEAWKADYDANRAQRTIREQAE